MDWKIDTYKEYHEKIYGFIKYHVKSEEIAQDLAHDVFVKLYTTYKISEIEEVESVVWTITRNCIIDHHRKAAHSQKYLNFLWDQYLTEQSPSQHLEFQETKELFKAALKNLTPQQWKIYNMKNEEGMNYKEISARLNLSISTIKNHMQAAHKSIRNYISSRKEVVISLIFWMVSIW